MIFSVSDYELRVAVMAAEARAQPVCLMDTHKAWLLLQFHPIYCAIFTATVKYGGKGEGYWKATVSS